MGVFNRQSSREIVDLVQGFSLKRQYNLFGQIITEINSRNELMDWKYDSIGRCTIITLPDGSSINYQTDGGHIRSVQRKSPAQAILYQHLYSRFDCNGHVAEEQPIFSSGPIVTIRDLLERPIKQTCPQMDLSIRYGSSGLVEEVNNSLFEDKLYMHDPLNQLKREGSHEYYFDSLGNPADLIVNELNQIIETSDGAITYDPNGNLKTKVLKSKEIEHCFDPLGRLIEVVVSNKRKVVYSYDPLSRLFSKESYLWFWDRWFKEQKIFYLYDQMQEIGTVDEKGDLIDLKILGLGVQGDIGAAVAIEVKGKVYAPLHDFNGNLIALLSPSGQVVDKYPMDAFGREHVSSPISPWRFSSKRSEEGLVFFGFRFYDSTLGRWLTPDPAGFVDGMNLYAYVRNAPFNRLDLFGLSSEDPFALPRIEIIVPVLSIPTDNKLFSVKMIEGGAIVDYFISCGHWHELKLTPHETHLGSINLLEHGELMNAPAGQIGLVTATHGINVKYEEFNEACEFLKNALSAGTLFIGRYHGTDGLLNDIWGVFQESFLNIETSKVTQARQFLMTCSQKLHQVNPAVFDDGGKVAKLGVMWSHYDHSRGGLIDVRALQGMPYEQKKVLQTQLLLDSIAPAAPIPRDCGWYVRNYYSKQDFVTGWFGSPSISATFGGVIGGLVINALFGHSDYDIQFVPCTSGWGERSFFVADHAFLGGTYRGVVLDSLDLNSRDYGFYNGKNR